MDDWPEDMPRRRLFHYVDCERTPTLEPILPLTQEVKNKQIANRDRIGTTPLLDFQIIVLRLHLPNLHQFHLVNLNQQTCRELGLVTPCQLGSIYTFSPTRINDIHLPLTSQESTYRDPSRLLA